jgi:hypothetical protein
MTTLQTKHAMLIRLNNTVWFNFSNFCPDFDGATAFTATKVLIYNTKSDQWIATMLLPLKNVFFGYTSTGYEVYAFGGTSKLE